MPSTPDSTEERVQRQFGAASRRYATSPVHAGGPDLAALVHAAQLDGTQRVLDLGCGAGATALALAGGAREVVALDLTHEMLERVAEQARARGLDHLTPREGNAEALPYPDGHFDVVACRLCAHHFAHPARAVHEAARVLAPGGRLVWVDIVAPEDPALDTFLNTIELLRDPSHVRDHTLAQWQSMLADAGLALDGEETWTMPQEFGAWLERIGTPEPCRAPLRHLLETATDAARECFAIGRDAEGRLHFSLHNALLRARRP